MVVIYTNTKPSSNLPIREVFVMISIFTIFVIPVSIGLFSGFNFQKNGTLLSPVPPEFEAEIMQKRANVVLAKPQVTTDPTTQATTTNNSQNRRATIKAGQNEIVVPDPALTENTTISISPISGDNSIYYLKSRTNTSFTIKSTTTTNQDRVIDYTLSQL